MPAKVLLVDDEQNVLDGYRRQLRKSFDIETAGGGKPGLEKVRTSGPFAVVVVDMNMPAMNGVQFLTELRKISPDTVRIMLTGNADQQTAVEAVNTGKVFSFLNKPCPPDELRRVISDGVQRYEVAAAEHQLLEDTLQGCVKVLTDVLRITVPESAPNTELLRRAVTKLAEKFSLGSVWEMSVAAMLSRIGFVSIPPPIIAKVRKKEKLTDVEADIVRRVPETGSRIIGKIPRLEGVAEIVLYQKKNFDGSGFPADGAKGEAIPIGARILRICNDIVRLDRDGLLQDEIAERLTARAEHYDPEILHWALRAYEYGTMRSESVSAGESVDVTELELGYRLISDIRASGGTLLIPSGQVVTETTLARIRNFAKVTKIKNPVVVEVPES